MDIKSEVIFDSGTSDGRISVRKQNFIEIDGQRNYIGSPERREFKPGQSEELSEYAPELVTICKAMWGQP